MGHEEPRDRGELVLSEDTYLGERVWVVPEAPKDHDGCAGCVAQHDDCTKGFSRRFDCSAPGRRTIAIYPRDYDRYVTDRVIRAIEGEVP